MSVCCARDGPGVACLDQACVFIQDGLMQSVRASRCCYDIDSYPVFGVEIQYRLLFCEDAGTGS